MGTPEDVATEKHFTPPTLTEMLKILGYREDIDLAKRIFKDWLKTVGLTDHYSPDKYGVNFNTTDSTRRLLIILVDEPSQEQVRKCTRCGAIRTDDIDSDICGNCADDLRMEQEALNDSPE